MNALDVKRYLDSLNGGWVDAEKTVDTFKCGNPAAELTGIAVGWMSYTDAIKQALALNCNLFITHEPTYYKNVPKNPLL